HLKEAVVVQDGGQGVGVNVRDRNVGRHPEDEHQAEREDDFLAQIRDAEGVAGGIEEGGRSIHWLPPRPGPSRSRQGPRALARRMLWLEGRAACVPAPFRAERSRPLWPSCWRA